MPRRGLATAERWRNVLGGGAFAVVGPPPVDGPRVGGFSGWADAPAGITLRFWVGPKQRLVEVETDGRERAHVRPGPMLAASLLINASHGRLRYPVVIEKAP